jgi:Ca-activated chloride channel family protein
MNSQNLILKFIILTPILWFVIETQPLAAENPDELYEQRRFVAAEKAYARLAVDHPQDIRYRYNQGCAAYQTANYREAKTAFSDVLRRAENDEMRFKAVYNLGNTAYQQKGFNSAVSYFKQALRYYSKSKEARYNLELALRALQKQKKDTAGRTKKDSQKDAVNPRRKGDPSKSFKNKNGDDRQQSKSKLPDPAQSPKMNRRVHEGQSESVQRKKPDLEHPAMTEKGRKHGQNSSKDLSSNPALLQDLPEGERKDQISDADKTMMDKKKAAALLENIKENRSRFLRFQIPEKYKKGVRSGKDW